MEAKKKKKKSSLADQKATKLIPQVRQKKSEVCAAADEGNSGSPALLVLALSSL